MVAPDSIIALQLCLGERPKALNVVDVVPFSGELSFAVVDPVVPVTVRKETIVRSERIGVDRASFGDFLFDNEAEDGSGNVGHGTCIDPAIVLEKPENSDFPGSTPAAIAFAVPAEITLIPSISPASGASCSHSPTITFRMVS